MKSLVMIALTVSECIKNRQTNKQTNKQTNRQTDFLLYIINFIFTHVESCYVLCWFFFPFIYTPPNIVLIPCFVANLVDVFQGMPDMRSSGYPHHSMDMNSGQHAGHLWSWLTFIVHYQLCIVHTQFSAHIHTAASSAQTAARVCTVDRRPREIARHVVITSASLLQSLGTRLYTSEQLLLDWSRILF